MSHDLAGDSAENASSGLDSYLERLRRMGFAQLRQVLLVGCEPSAWILALAQLNKRVTVVDSDLARLNSIRTALGGTAPENVRFICAPAHELPYPDNRFDAILCPAVAESTTLEDALIEFSRVLKSGGRVYLCTAGRGWWLKLWLRNCLTNPHARRVAWQALRKSRPATDTRAAQRLLGKGWKVLAAAPEGQTHLVPDIPVRASLRPATFFGFHCVGEMVARLKRKPWCFTPDPADVWAGLHARVAATLARTHHRDFVATLDAQPQPRPAIDLVNHCNERVVDEAVQSALAVDRLDLLRRLFRLITDGCASDLDRVRRCLDFVKDHLYFHWAGQPTKNGNVMVQDPIALLLLENARCGASARCLSDLLACNGIPARMLGLSCHTIAEVCVDGRWILADTSLYPAGIWPTGPEGGPLTLEQATANPALLDAAPAQVNQHHQNVEAFAVRYPETYELGMQVLRNPAFPSAAYFGELCLASRQGGLRFIKRGTPEDWNRDTEFGWNDCEQENVPLPMVPVQIRPEQVKSVRLDGNVLCWDRPFWAQEGAGTPAYRVIVRGDPRPWSYQAAPLGCDFAVHGHEIAIHQESVPLTEVLAHGHYLTIIAGDCAALDAGVFHLPSNEFDLGSLPGPSPHGVSR